MIVLVCYGETEDSVNKVVPSSFYNRLTSSGEDTAYQYYEALAGVTFEHAFASESSPALRTAEVILPYRAPADTVSSPCLIEPSGGTYEGRPYMDLKRLLPPREYRLWDRDFFSSPPNGESLADVSERVISFIETEVKPKASANVLVAIGPIVMKILIGYFQKLEEADIILLQPMLLPYMFDLRRD